MMVHDPRFAALFGPADEIADDGFSARVLALAALEDRLAARRRAGFRRAALEGLALVAVLAAFAALARFAPVGEVVPLASPAMMGLLMLTAWLGLGLRGSTQGG